MPDVCFHVSVEAGEKDTKVCYVARPSDICGCDCSDECECGEEPAPAVGKGKDNKIVVRVNPDGTEGKDKDTSSKGKQE